MKYFHLPKKVSIQWLVLRQHFVATIGTVISTILVLFVASLTITELTPWQFIVEDFIGIPFYSIPYFVIMIVILAIGILIAIFFTIFVGFPLGREMKRNLQEITDGAEAFSRGKLHHRIKASGFNETEKISQHFNRMADRINKQVNKLQELVDENVKLVNQTKLTAALDERRKLARDLHDAVSQELFAISMTLAALPRLMEQDTVMAKKYFAQVENMVVNAQQELRALLMHLRPVTLEGNSLVEGIHKLLEELKQKHPQIHWEWEIDMDLALSQGVEDQLFRVVQEAISNILRHAKAKTLWFKLYKKQERIIMHIEDNGIGFEVEDKKSSSYGINNMKERIEDIGGRFDIYTYKGKGTRIEIRVPIQS